MISEKNSDRLIRVVSSRGGHYYAEKTCQSQMTPNVMKRPEMQIEIKHCFKKNTRKFKR